MKKIMTFTVCAFLAATVAMANQNPTIGINNISGEAGSSAVIEISLDNDVEFNDYQFVLSLPDESFSITKDEYDLYNIHTTPRAATHVLTAEYKGEGVYAVLGASLQGVAIKSGTGNIATIEIKLGEPGEYTYSVTAIEISRKETVDGVLKPVAYHPADVEATISVTALEDVRYGYNQLYVKDITINEGEDAVMQVGYNSASALHEYSAEITLPEGVTVGEVSYTEVLTSVNYTTEDEFAAGVLTLSGEQSGSAKKPKPAEAGNHIFAEVALNTASLAAGEYRIQVGAQYLSNEDDENDGEYNPATYEAILKVKAATSVLEACAMPEIEFDGEGNIKVTCATEGAQIHTNVHVDDHKTAHHESGAIIPLTGQYVITSYATAPDRADSKTATATLAWVRSGSQLTVIEATQTVAERPVLIRSVGNNIVIAGTEEGESVEVFTTSGMELYRGAAKADSFTLPMAAARGSIYLIRLGDRTIKYRF